MAGETGFDQNVDTADLKILRAIKAGMAEQQQENRPPDGLTVSQVRYRTRMQSASIRARLASLAQLKLLVLTNKAGFERFAL